MKKSDERNGSRMEKSRIDATRLVKKEYEIELQAEVNAQKMKDNILNMINKRVAGRAEGIDKVQGYLEKTHAYNEQQKAMEEKKKAEKIAEMKRLAAERQAAEDAKIENYCRLNGYGGYGDEEQSEPETPVFQKIKKQTEMKPSNFQITPLKADYLEKQLAHMKVEHLMKNRHSEITSMNRRSEMTQASTMNNTLYNNDDEDMPFAIANSCKHQPKKSLMLAANNMMSPKSTKQTVQLRKSDMLRVSTRKNSVTFE